VKILFGDSELRARLDFFDFDDTGSHQLSVVLTDTFDRLLENGTINLTITNSTGSFSNFFLNPSYTWNYSVNYSFDHIGYYNISVNITYSNFQNISGTKRIYIGLVEFSDFSNEQSIFQGTTAFFRLTARTVGNFSSQIIPVIKIYDSNNNLVFSKTGTLTTIEGNRTVALLQYNTLVFNVGSTPAGDYKVVSYMIFTDRNNNAKNTPERISLLKVLSQPSLATSVGSGGDGSISREVINRIVSEEQNIEIFPTPTGYVEFLSTPVFIDTQQGEQRVESILLQNVRGIELKNIRIRLEGIPDEWISILNGPVNIGSGESKELGFLISPNVNAIPGNYQIKVIIEGDDFNREFFMLVKINPQETSRPMPAIAGGAYYREIPENPTIFTSVRVNEKAKETHFYVKIKNKEKAATSVKTILRIHKEIASNAGEIFFSERPSRIIEADPVVEFTLNDLKPFEERNISYYVKKIVNTTAPFVFSSIEQVSVTEKLPEFEVEDDYIVLTVFAATLTIATGFAVLYLRTSNKKKNNKHHHARKIIVRFG